MGVLWRSLLYVSGTESNFNIIFLFKGIHYIGQMFGETMTKVLTDQVTEGQVVWEQLDDAFDVVSILELDKSLAFIDGNLKIFHNRKIGQESIGEYSRLPTSRAQTNECIACNINNLYNI
jgi:hypothetical protein